SESGPRRVCGRNRGRILTWPALLCDRHRAMAETILGHPGGTHDGRNDLLRNRRLLSGRHLCQSAKRHQRRFLLGLESALPTLPALAHPGAALPAQAFRWKGIIDGRRTISTEL